MTRTSTAESAAVSCPCVSSHWVLVALALLVSDNINPHFCPQLETNNIATALRTALQELGFDDCYHMMSASVENPPDCLMWSDALASKYDGKGTFGREQWDQLLGHCQAVCDWPAVAFAKELIEAYPDAKVLVTTRDIDSWHASTMKTVHWRATEPELKAVGKFDWAAGMYQPMLSSKFACSLD